jgi:thioredoxin 1
MTSTAPAALGTTNFDRHLTAAPEPLLVESWATGCRPCQALMPLIKEIAAECA